MEFYTYLWLRKDGTPYYVGKGCGKRAWQSTPRHRPPNDVSRILIQEFPSEKDAFTAERFLIAYYGRKDLRAGILINLTDGGEGLSNPSEGVRSIRRKTGKKLAESGQMAKMGKLGGQRVKKLGIGIFGMTLESRKAANSLGGKRGGLVNAASGQSQRLGWSRKGQSRSIPIEHQRIAGKLGGEAAKESGLISTLGKVQGLKNVESGHIRELGKRYGKINGKKNAEKNNHLRWHVNRNKTRPDCLYCKGLNNVNNSDPITD
jgi:hypothetical protein